MTKTMTTSERDIAERYNETGDVSDFGETIEPVEVRRNVTISVRFSADEMETLRRSADAIGMKVTAFIRAVALEAKRAPLDVAALAEATASAERQLRAIRQSLRVAESGTRGAAKFEVYEDKAGKFRFRLVAANGQVVATGGPYESRAAAHEGCEAAQRAANAAINEA